MAIDTMRDFANAFADFGVAATVGGVAVVGIFDKSASQAIGIVAGTDPQLVVTDSVAASEGTTVVVGGTNYLVKSVEDDGTGLRVLMLERQS